MYAMPCADSSRVRRVGIDSSGLNLSSIFQYREYKWRAKKKYRGWLKIHCLFDVDSGEVLAYILTDETVGDSPMLPQLLELASMAGYKMDVCYADAAYSGIENWKAVCWCHDMTFVTPFKCNTNTKSYGCMEMGEAKKMWHELPYEKWLEISGYGIRWKAECGFSDLKRVAGENIRARTYQGMVREVFGKMVAFNYHKQVRANILEVTGNGVRVGVQTYRTEYHLRELIYTVSHIVKHQNDIVLLLSK